MLILFCIRGCGRIERPAFPAPSELRVNDPSQTRVLRLARSCSCVFAQGCCLKIESVAHPRLSSSAKRMIRYSRDASDGIERPRRTGYSAGACHRARRRRDPGAGDDDLVWEPPLVRTSECESFPELLWPP